MSARWCGMIEGRIECVTALAPFDAADVHIWVEDTTYADAAGILLFHYRMPDVSSADVSAGLPFKLDYPARPPAGRRYTLSVLVDLDGDGRPGRGDYISYEAVTIPAEGAVARVRIRRVE